MLYRFKNKLNMVFLIILKDKEKATSRTRLSQVDTELINTDICLRRVS